MTTCPGCSRPLHYADADDCDHCEYFNLACGRYHYCGDDACYCRNLRGTMRPEVLQGFADRYRAAQQAST